jgi:Fe-S-cluster containining protein
MPIFFECDRCTACCRWPGQVRLTDDEIARIAAFRGLSDFDFVQQFTRLASDRKGLALQDKPNGECIFLHGSDCAINPVKPQQCRDFPNLWNFPGFRQTCRAREVILNDEDYAQAIQRATGRAPGIGSE